MRPAVHHLRLVHAPASAGGPAPPAPGDVGLVVALLATNLVPIVGELAHAGRWGTGTVGLATAGALLAGRELAAQLRAWLRTRA
jgi:hypothetical protein